MQQDFQQIVPIHLVITPEFNMLATMAFLDPFRAANYLEGRTLFRWQILSESGGDVVASNGASLSTKPLEAADISGGGLVILSSSWRPETFASPALLAYIRRAAKADLGIGAIDTGAFLMAQAGLLVGRRATVHYEHLDTFIELYPDTVAEETLYVLDGNRMSCAGGAASIDFALQILRGFCGDAVSQAAAGYIFAADVRAEGASQNSIGTARLGQQLPDKLRAAVALMERNLEEPLSIAALCEQIALSQRQLDRLFQRHVGKSPSLYYRDVRLDRARGFVTQTRMPLSEVALACGFASQVHFSRAYRQRFGLAPSKDRIEGRIPFEFRVWPMYRPNKVENLAD